MDVEESRLHHAARLHRALGDVHRLAILEAVQLSDRTSAELAELTSLPSNLLAFHLDVLADAGLVERRRSDGDRRRRYVRLRPDGLARLAPPPALPTLAVEELLFVCTRNSARSQFAAALWQARTGRPCSSAGSDPAPGVHPLAVMVAADHGLDLSEAKPSGYEAVRRRPGLVVSVCDRAHEAGIPFEARRVHWAVADPADRDRAAFEVAFLEIAERIDHFAGRLAA